MSSRAGSPRALRGSATASRYAARPWPMMWCAQHPEMEIGLRRDLGLQAAVEVERLEPRDEQQAEAVEHAVERALVARGPSARARLARRRGSVSKLLARAPRPPSARARPRSGARRPASGRRRRRSPARADLRRPCARAPSAVPSRLRLRQKIASKCQSSGSGSSRSRSAGRARAAARADRRSCASTTRRSRSAASSVTGSSMTVRHAHARAAAPRAARARRPSGTACPGPRDALHERVASRAARRKQYGSHGAEHAAHRLVGFMPKVS